MTSHYSLNLMTREDCFLLHVESVPYMHHEGEKGLAVVS